MKHFWLSRNRSSLATRLGLLVVLAMVLTLLPSAMVGADKGAPPTANPKQFVPHRSTFGPDGVTPVPNGAVIDNGTVQLGVNYEGHLNVSGDNPSSGTGTPWVGLRYMPTNAEATAPGCLCEGWGVGDAISGFSGWASIDDGGIVNVTQISFDTGVDAGGAGWAKCVVQVGNTFSVTQDYHASASPNLYEATVTIENISPADTDVRYRRVMDWDVEPTAFSEYVTIYTGGATRVLFSSDDGFATSDPLAGPSSLLFTGEAVDSGPSDHGALFDFGFGLVPAGGKVAFQIYYGAAGTEIEALDALAAVKAEVYSLGQPSTPDGPTLGTPNTFIFGFKGVGGTPVGAKRVFGWVFQDPNENGYRDLAETEGVFLVPLILKQDGKPIAYTKSVPPHGWYEFDAVPAGDYCVEAVIPPEWVPTGPTEVCFTMGDVNKMVNFGVVPFQASIGDLVFYDLNNNGALDAGEPGVANVTMALWSSVEDAAGAANVAGTPSSSVDSSPGAIIAETTTDADGNYLFHPAVPGTYFVQVTDKNGELTGLTLTAGANPAGPITVVHQQDYLDADFGYGVVCAAGRGGVWGRVWNDADANGAQDMGEAGIKGVWVCAQPLSYLSTRCRATNTQGYYRICLPKGTYLVAPDKSGDGPLWGMTPTTQEFHLPVVVQSGGLVGNLNLGYR